MSYEKHIYIGSLYQSMIEAVGDDEAREVLERQQRRIRVAKRLSARLMERQSRVTEFIERFCVEHNLDSDKLDVKTYRHGTPAKNKLMYQLSRKFGMSYPEIGEIFNKTNYAVCWAVRQHRELIGER